MFKFTGRESDLKECRISPFQSHKVSLGRLSFKDLAMFTALFKIPCESTAQYRGLAGMVPGQTEMTIVLLPEFK